MAAPRVLRKRTLLAGAVGAAGLAALAGLFEPPWATRGERGQQADSDGADGGTWEPLPSAGAPRPRMGHVALWTGREMLVWGGRASSVPHGESSHSFADGGLFRPATGAWRPIPASDVLATPGDREPAAVWTGRELLVWSLGAGGGAGGARFDPASGAWRALPELRSYGTVGGHTAVWTGTELVAWGGAPWEPRNSAQSGARFHAATGRWTTIRAAGAPERRFGHTAVWTGREMLVWGGNGRDSILGDGASYDPRRDRWRPLSSAGAPSARRGHTAVWTGRFMLVWGGAPSPYTRLAGDGAAYDPASDRWTSLAAEGAPSPRTHHTAVWTGRDMIVWGGMGVDRLENTGGRYDPARDTWRPVAPSGLEPRWLHSAVWTGGDMLVWGGFTGGFRPHFGDAPPPQLGDGGRYRPAAAGRRGPR